MSGVAPAAGGACRGGIRLLDGMAARQPDPSGVRRASHSALPARVLGGLLPLCGVLCALVLLMLARRDDIGPVSDSLSLGLLSSLTALAILMLWLEWGSQRGAVWIWLPLALPALPLVSGRYAVALWLGIDGQYAAVLWSHMLWVLPWMLWCYNRLGAGSIPGLSSLPERWAGGGRKFSG